MKQSTSNMVWYACYGSNMDSGRFSKYIQGGQLIVNGVVKDYSPCPVDASPPQQSEPYSIDRRFFFAKKSKTWNQHGVGFISNKRNKRSKTFAKLYLISESQFSHLFAQENGRQTSHINYKQILNNGYLDFEYNFYNRILLMDENYAGFPILTFTNKSNLTTTKPMSEYVNLISNGLKLTHGLSNKEVFDYLGKNGSGVRKKDLKKMLD